MYLFRPNVEKLKRKGKIARLIKVMHHRDTEIRKDAIKALGEIDDSKAVEALIQAFGDDDSPMGRLILDLRRGSPDTRVQAAKLLVKVLEKIEDLSEIQEAKYYEAACVASLQDEESWVRYASAMMLGRLKSRDSANPLAKLLDDENPDTRLIAARSLMEIGDSRGDRFAMAAQAARESKSTEALRILVMLAEEAAVTTKTGRVGFGSSGIGALSLPELNTCYAIALGLQGNSARAKGILSKFSDLAKEDSKSNPNYGAKLLAEIAEAYAIIGDRSAARQTFEAVIETASDIQNPGSKTDVLIVAAKYAHTGREEDVCSDMLARAKRAAQSGIYNPRSAEYERLADPLSLLKVVNAAEAEIKDQPSGVGEIFVAHAKNLAPPVDDFLSAIVSDIPAAIRTAESIADPYNRLIAIVTIMAQLYDHSRVK